MIKGVLMDLKGGETTTGYHQNAEEREAFAEETRILRNRKPGKHQAQEKTS